MRYWDLTDEQRVVITGCGAVTPCGTGVGPVVDAALAGRSALTTVTLGDGRAIGGGPADAPSLGEVDRTTALAVAAADEALAAVPDEMRSELGVIVGTGKPAMRLVERVHRGLLDEGPGSIPAEFIQHALPNAPGDAIAQRFGCHGVRLAFVGACSTGLDCVAMAARFVRSGRCRAALAGSSEASLTPLVVAAFERMGVLAPDGSEPRHAIRPFARDRCGFLIGEGAGVLLVETLASAKARDADILAEVAGSAIVSDAHDPITLAPDGAGVAHAIGRALDAAGLAPNQIDHVNAHGTATRVNDLVETRGIRAALGEHAGNVKVCSTKPVTGHLLSASGSVELIIALGAMRAGVAPPTINLDEADPGLDLDYTPNAAVERPSRHALVLNYGFGAHVGAVILSRWMGR